jgi:hypothetical protein
MRAVSFFGGNPGAPYPGKQTPVARRRRIAGKGTVKEIQVKVRKREK